MKPSRVEAISGVKDRALKTPESREELTSRVTPIGRE